ncbi:MAG: hypothetical protein ACKV19_13240, partial [Verrucomicrobiales bacterium]
PPPPPRASCRPCRDIDRTDAAGIAHGTLRLARDRNLLTGLLGLSVGLAGLPATPLRAQNPSEDPPDSPIRFDFEEPQFLPGSIHAQHGWWVDQGGSAVVPGLGLEGSAGLAVEPADPFSQGRLTLLRPGSTDSALFLDFRVRLRAAEWLVLEESFDIDSARIGLFRTTDDPSLAEWHVFHGNGTGDGMWLNTGVAAAIDPLTDVTTGWIRLTIREDLSDATWDFWVDGHLTATGLGFQFPPDPGETYFFILGDPYEPVILDDVTVSIENPPGLVDQEVQPPEPPPGDHGPAGDPADPDADALLDSDADGLPDAWEMAHGLNALDPTDAAIDLDGDGLTALDEYLIGSDVGNKDVRRSVVSHNAEVFNRFAGVSTRRAVVPAP